jgi:hypothetical protein
MTLTLALSLSLRLRENYMVGSSGSLSKRSVYNHYLNVTKQVTKKPLISPTVASAHLTTHTARPLCAVCLIRTLSCVLAVQFFGKLVKRAFPSIKCNRKGPRGHTKQVR